MVDEFKPIKEEIIGKRKFNLLGYVFYGDPFHPKAEDNEIARLWKNFISVLEKYPYIVEEWAIPESNAAYEIYLIPEDFKETKKCFVFVALEVKNCTNIPIELYFKDLPEAEYMHFIFKGKYMYRGSEYIYNYWLPQSEEYEEAFPYLILAYTDRYNRFARYDLKNEVDYYIPIKRKEEK